VKEPSRNAKQHNGQHEGWKVAACHNPSSTEKVVPAWKDLVVPNRPLLVQVSIFVICGMAGHTALGARMVHVLTVVGSGHGDIVPNVYRDTGTRTPHCFVGAR